MKAIVNLRALTVTSATSLSGLRALFFATRPLQPIEDSTLDGNTPPKKLGFEANVWLGQSERGS
jgi:hypothetical protein